MKYTCCIEIERPLDEVIALFDDPDNLAQWQPELISMEHLSGERGEPGAKTKLLYQMGNREVEMIETILTRKLPDEISMTFEAKGVYNIVRNTFEPVNAQTTLWTSEQEFRFRGLMRLIAPMMGSSFRKQSQIFLERFKAFAESKANTQG